MAKLPNGIDPLDDMKPIGLCSMKEIAAHIVAREQGPYFTLTWANRNRPTLWYIIGRRCKTADSTKALRDVLSKYLRGSFDIDDTGDGKSGNGKKKD